MPKATRIKRAIKDEDEDYLPDTGTQDSGSAKKRGKKASNSPTKKKKPSPQPESEWRKSKIPEDTKILKTDAAAQYRLKGDDFDGIPVQIKYPQNPIYQPSHIYSERDIERRAWEKHGGPEGWDFYLESLRERHRKQIANKTAKRGFFVEPSSHSNPFGESPQEMRLRVEFTTKLGGEWVWKAVDEVVDRQHTDIMGQFFLNQSERVELLRKALPGGGGVGRFEKHTLDPYPPRPSSPLPSSAPLDQLRHALARVPKDWYKDGRLLPEIFEASDLGNPVFDWAEDVYNDIYEALICIIQELGVGAWMDARWEVYDKYAESLGGITYGRSIGWYDGADTWLKGKVSGKMYEDISIGCTGRLRTDVGRRYNDLLPVLHPGQ